MSTETQRLQTIRDILHVALLNINSNLGPDDVSVEEEHHETSPDTTKYAYMKRLHSELSYTDGKAVIINISKINLKNMRLLKILLTDLTKFNNSFNFHTRQITFHGSSEELLSKLNIPVFNEHVTAQLSSESTPC